MAIIEITLQPKVHIVKAIVCSSHVQIWSLDHKEGWAPKNWCFQIVVLEKTLEGPSDSKEIKPVIPKGDQTWIFIGRTYAKAEAHILWPLDVKSWLIGKDPNAGRDWRQEGKGITEDERVGWHHRLNGHEFEQTLRDGEGQGSWHATVHGVSESQTWLNDWTTKNDRNPGTQRANHLKHWSLFGRSINKQNFYIRGS